jgi:hypothetical protein
MNILTPVGPGELYDKISILEIKSEKITDEQKLALVRYELSELQKVAQPHPVDAALYAKLKDINLKIWAVEDDIRTEEKKQAFGEEFVGLARSVYILNDQRAMIKKEINLRLGSDIVEVKGHATVV